MNRYFKVLKCALVLGAYSGVVVAQNGWNMVAASPGLGLGQLAYDSLRDRVVSNNGGFLDECDGTAWSRATPTPNWGSSWIAYDESRQRIVFFVGSSTPATQPPSAWPTQTWEWDGATWSLMNSLGPDLGAATFDSGRNTLVALGCDAANGGGFLYEWDGTNWNLVQSVGGLPMAGPQLHSAAMYPSMAYDARRDRLCAFGKAIYDTVGTHTYPSVPETWEWDPSNGWVLRNSVGPVPGGVVFDEARGVLSVFEAYPSRAIHDWDDAAGQWVLHSAAPSGVFYGDFPIYDGRRSRILVLAGYPQDFWSYAPVNAADYVPHGMGCSGGLGIPTLSPFRSWTLPWIGDTFSCAMSNLPSSSCFLATGLTDQSYAGQPLPIDLSANGLPGCFLRIVPAVVILSTGLPGSGTSSFAMGIPNSLSLVGVNFYQQALVLAPGANAAGLVVSDSMRGVVGNRN